MDRSSGFGQPTYPPSHHGCPVTVALWVFVPFTAAGQRGLLTPLPDIHLYFTFNKVFFKLTLKKKPSFVKSQKTQRSQRAKRLSLAEKDAEIGPDDSGLD